MGGVILTKKEQLYYLLKAYLRKEYDVQSFCQAFEDIFYPDIPFDELNSDELKIFEELGFKVVRFSSFDEDLTKYSKVYYSNKDIDSAIVESYSKLIIINPIMN